MSSIKKKPLGERLYGGKKRQKRIGKSLKNRKLRSVENILAGGSYFRGNIGSICLGAESRPRERNLFIVWQYFAG